MKEQNNHNNDNILYQVCWYKIIYFLHTSKHTLVSVPGLIYMRLTTPTPLWIPMHPWIHFPKITSVIWLDLRDQQTNVSPWSYDLPRKGLQQGRITPINPRKLWSYVHYLQWIDMVDWIGLRGSHNFLQIAFAAKFLEFSELLPVSSSSHTQKAGRTGLLVCCFQPPVETYYFNTTSFPEDEITKAIKSNALCAWAYGAMSHLPEHNCSLPYMHLVIRVSFCHNRNKTFLSGFRWNKKGFNPNRKMSEANRKRIYRSKFHEEVLAQGWDFDSYSSTDLPLPIPALS